jgi:hypothetical protein
MTTDADESCGAVWDSPTGRRNVCVRQPKHEGPHSIADGTAVWVDPGQPGWTPGRVSRRAGRIALCPCCGQELKHP